MLGWLKDRKVESVAMESTSVYWIPVADLLEANGLEVVLVDTREVRMVPGRKSPLLHSSTRDGGLIVEHSAGR